MIVSYTIPLKDDGTNSLCADISLTLKELILNLHR